MGATAQDVLGGWLKRHLSAEQHAWLDAQRSAVAAQGASALHRLFGLAPRRLGRADLDLSPADLAAAEAARPGWDPRGWTVADAARISALLDCAASLPEFPRLFADLCRSADVGEAIALYRGLPLYPEPERLEAQAAEGLRTHMRAVFEAIAHRSPYPCERFGEERWNHMVLKALFVGSALDPIQGLDRRANPTLAAILSDYAHERWAAGRPVPPELWRLVGPFAEGRLLDDLKRAAAGTPEERQAAALALAASPAAEARRLLDSMPDLAEAVRGGRIGWASLSQPL